MTDEDLISQIVEHGISESWARISLRRCGNVRDAIAFCIESGALEEQQVESTPIPESRAHLHKKKKKKGNGLLSRTFGGFMSTKQPSLPSQNAADDTPAVRTERDVPTSITRAESPSAQDMSEESPEMPPAYDALVPPPAPDTSPPSEADSPSPRADILNRPPVSSSPSQGTRIRSSSAGPSTLRAQVPSLDDSTVSSGASDFPTEEGTGVVVATCLSDDALPSYEESRGDISVIVAEGTPSATSENSRASRYDEAVGAASGDDERKSCSLELEEECCNDCGVSAEVVDEEGEGESVVGTEHAVSASLASEDAPAATETEVESYVEGNLESPIRMNEPAVACHEMQGMTVTVEAVEGELDTDDAYCENDVSAFEVVMDDEVHHNGDIRLEDDIYDDTCDGGVPRSHSNVTVQSSDDDPSTRESSMRVVSTSTFNLSLSEMSLNDDDDDTSSVASSAMLSQSTKINSSDLRNIFGTQDSSDSLTLHMEALDCGATKKKAGVGVTVDSAGTITPVSRLQPDAGPMLTAINLTRAASADVMESRRAVSSQSRLTVEERAWAGPAREDVGLPSTRRIPVKHSASSPLQGRTGSGSAPPLSEPAVAASSAVDAAPKEEMEYPTTRAESPPAGLNGHAVPAPFPHTGEAASPTRNAAPAPPTALAPARVSPTVSPVAPASAVTPPAAPAPATTSSAPIRGSNVAQALNSTSTRVSYAAPVPLVTPAASDLESGSGVASPGVGTATPPPAGNSTTPTATGSAAVAATSPPCHLSSREYAVAPVSSPVRGIAVAGCTSRDQPAVSLPVGVVTALSSQEVSWHSRGEMRPESIARLPQANVVMNDDMDDDTVHGEAYMALSSGSAVNSSTSVSSLYLRDDRGGVYVAVAAPLQSLDEASSTSGTDQSPSIQNEEDDEHQERRRGLFSYARHRLYGDDHSRRRRGEVSGGAKRRVFLPFDISEREGNFYPNVHLRQPKLGPNMGPQHNRPPILHLAPSSSRGLAIRHAEVNTPPMWAGGSDRRECVICYHSAGLLYKIHHCRNCGHYVCNNCSKKDWPATMLPRTYVPEKESLVRVCDSCSYLQEGFVDSLRVGDVNMAMAFFSTGNVNLHSPMTIYKSEEYPLHAASQGGNIHLVKWLLEVRKCSLRNVDGDVIRTSEGLTPLAIAAYFGHHELMVYFVRRHGCAVTEIKDFTVLLRGLHSALGVSRVI